MTCTPIPFVNEFSEFVGPGIFKEPIERYEARRSQLVTAHSLREFMQSPAKFKRPDPRVWKPQYAVGEAIHCAVLEGPRTFSERYEIGGPVNKTTGKSYGMDSKKFSDFAADKKHIVTPEVAELVRTMFDAIYSNQDAFALLHKAAVEITVRASLGPIECQSRLDLYCSTRGVTDIKTIDDIGQSAVQIEQYGYKHQMAFYRQMVREITGDTLPVFLIFAEKKTPHRVKVEELNSDELNAAERENEIGLRALARCRKNRVWPKQFNLQQEMWS